MKIPTSFRHKITSAVTQLKERLIARYERIAPDRSGPIREAIAAAESQAWETPFPHLFFPDFAALRLATVVASDHPKFVTK